MRAHGPQIAALATLLTFAVACGGSSKQNKPTVVVLAVKGKKAKRVRSDIVKVVESGNYPLLQRSKYDRTARRLDAEKVKSSNVRKVAKNIGANAVVTARLKPRGKKYSLQVTVRDGKSGKRVERFTLKLSKRKLNKKARGRLKGKLLAALGKVSALDPADSGEKVASKSKSKKKKKKKSKKKREREEKAAKKAEKRKREALAEEREEEEEAEEEKEEKKAAKREKRDKRDRAAKKAKREKKEARDAKAEKTRKKKEKAATALRAKNAEKARKKRAKAAALKKERAAKAKAKAAAEKARRKAEAERKRKAREARRKKKEKEELDKAIKPSTRDDGQVIDDEDPSGL